MQVTSNAYNEPLKASSSQGALPESRPAAPVSSSSLSRNVLSSEVVTLSASALVTTRSDLLQPVASASSAADLSPDGNDLSERIVTEGDENTYSINRVDPNADENGPGDEARGEDQDSGSEAASNANDASRETNSESGTRDRSDGELSPQQKEAVAELSARDAEVKAHERAHKTVGGQYAGSMSFNYQQGPDGKRYAIGGEVSIDVAPVEGDPQATIDKMRQVKAAALAPNEPSTQDRNVAATASRLLIDAQIELAEQKRQEGIEAREKISENDEQRKQAVQTYESLIGLGVKEVDPSDLIDELI